MRAKDYGRIWSYSNKYGYTATNMCAMPRDTCTKTHLCACCVSFVRVPGLICVCTMTHNFVP